MKKSLAPKILVLYIQNHKLCIYEFSTIELARRFVKDLKTKEYKIVVGHLCNEGFKE